MKLSYSGFVGLGGFVEGRRFNGDMILRFLIAFFNDLDHPMHNVIPDFLFGHGFSAVNHADFRLGQGRKNEIPRFLLHESCSGFGAVQRTSLCVYSSQSDPACSHKRDTLSRRD